MGFLPMLFVIKFALGTPNKEFFNNKGLPWLCFVNCFDPKYYDPSLRLPQITFQFTVRHHL